MSADGETLPFMYLDAELSEIPHSSASSARVRGLRSQRGFTCFKNGILSFLSYLQAPVAILQANLKAVAIVTMDFHGVSCENNAIKID